MIEHEKYMIHICTLQLKYAFKYENQLENKLDLKDEPSIIHHKHDYFYFLKITRFLPNVLR